jgi:hypothetical protein
MFIPEIPDNQLFEKIKEIIEIAIDLEEETYFEFSDASTNDEINEWQQKMELLFQILIKIGCFFLMVQ